MKGYYLMPHPPVMVAEVGKGRENDIKDTVEACEKVAKEIEALNVETIILITPHGTVFRDGIAFLTESVVQGDFKNFGAPEVRIQCEINNELTEAIMRNSEDEGIPTIGLNKETAKQYGVDILLDHGALVPLYYVMKNHSYQLVHITYGMLNPMELYRFGMIISKTVKQLGERAVFIASGDLSHCLIHDGPYPFSPYGKIFDQQVIEFLGNGDFQNILSMDEKTVREAGECGLRSIYVLAGTMDGYRATGNVYSYEGTFGVGYGVVSFKVEKGISLYEVLTQLGEEKHQHRMKNGHPYTTLARKALEHFYSKGGLLSTPQEDIYTKEKKGVFVSLKIQGTLRGCIGTIEPVTKCVGDEIIRNAIAAATEDPRFHNVRYEELQQIDLSVDVLHEPESATIEQLDPKHYGVIVSKGIKRGLLLPNLEGVNTVEEQLEIALDKGRITDEEYEIQRFKVERYSEVKDNA